MIDLHLLAIVGLLVFLAVGLFFAWASLDAAARANKRADELADMLINRDKK